MSSEFLPLTVSLLEELHNDDSEKNVELVASDGSVRAHSCLLAACAEPLRKMLSSSMVESRSKRVQMPDFKVAELKFIMRLLFTGAMDPSEWPPTQLDISVVATDRQGKNVVDFKMRSTQPYGKLMSRWCEHHNLQLSDATFYVNGHKLDPAQTPASTGLMQCDIHAFPAAEVGAEEMQPPEQDDSQPMYPPLELLFAAASFAKRYNMEAFLSIIIEHLKARVSFKEFEAITVLAVEMDLAPVRLACLLYARESKKIAELFKQRAFKPEVLFELQAIWSAIPEKKRRFAQALNRTSLGAYASAHDYSPPC